MNAQLRGFPKVATWGRLSQFIPVRTQASLLPFPPLRSTALAR